MTAIADEHLRYGGRILHLCSMSDTGPAPKDAATPPITPEEAVAIADSVSGGYSGIGEAVRSFLDRTK